MGWSCDVVKGERNNNKLDINEMLIQNESLAKDLKRKVEDR